MVKTFLCHPFNKLNSFSDQYEATSICCQQNSYMFVATSTGYMHIYNIDKVEYPLEHSFASCGVVLKMEYCEKEKFLVTLETKLQDYKTGVTSKNVSCQVRVYLNIHLSVNHRVYTSVAYGYSAALDAFDYKFTIVDLYLPQSVCDMSLCKIKHNIAAASGSKIQIFTFVEKNFIKHDEKTNTVIDFYPLLEVECHFRIQYVSFYINWLAFSCNNELRVVQVFLNSDDASIYLGEDVSELLDSIYNDPDDKSTNLTTHYSFEDEVVIWNFDQGSGMELNKKAFKNEQIGFGFVEVEAPYIDTGFSSKELLGWFEKIPGHPLTVKSQNTEQATCITRLYRRFELSEISFNGMVENIHSLQWLPVFSNENFDNQTTEMGGYQINNCFRIPTDLSLLTLGFFFSTGKHGFLYDLTKTPKSVVVYTYTSDCYFAKHSISLLDIVTKNGLEVYSSRLYAIAVENYQNFKKSRNESAENEIKKINLTDCDSVFDGETLTSFYCYDSKYLQSPCTWSDVDLCLVGFYSLSNINLLQTSSTKRVFLVKIQSKSKIKFVANVISWNISVMTKASMPSIYSNIMGLIQGSELTNPTVYYQLLSEAHMFVRSHLCYGIESDEKELLILLMKDSALKMADFLICCGTMFAYYLQVSEFYSLAGLSFEQSIKRLIMEPKQKYGPGMIVYLNEMVLGDKKVSGKKFLLNDKMLCLDKEVIVFILDIYCEYKPFLLSKVIFDSRINNIEPGLALAYLSKMKFKSDSRFRPYDYLCYAILNMELGDPTQAENCLKEISEDSLATVCINHYDLLTSNFTSPICQLLKKRFKFVFTKILVSLFADAKIDVPTILNIFQKSNNGQTVYSYNVCRVLEGILDDVKHKDQFTDIAIYLIEQYLARVSKRNYSEKLETNHHHVPKGNGHFAVRFKWLDSMLPFSGDTPCPQDCIFKPSTFKSSSQQDQMSSNVINRKPFLHSISSYSQSNNLEDSKNLLYCHCCCCCAILLKLQSLLCSKYCTKQLVLKVLKLLDEYSFVGKDTLMLLCWSRTNFIRECVVYLMTNYIDLAIQCANDLFVWKSQWQTLLQYVFELLKNNDMELNKPAIIKVLHGVLHRLTRAYSPIEFFNFLPCDGNMQFFLPHILECWFYTQANSVKKEITTKCDYLIESSSLLESSSLES
ncbi:BLOC-2 complex member HPS3 isoform X1 [Hydra vulgaris]|uniref:BLOC-2 complex member HPS3 isoform X1 n=1 Tax=Hydra vulgaris TaxID=6087 RepID=UPI001F5F514E|nr:Hermansky-Pudlak syndrome 3 protein homolog isoform X1 [Hydra vulgaris]